MDLDKLVDITVGLTGSDLHELCRNAAMIPMRELMRKHDPSTLENDVQVSVQHALKHLFTLNSTSIHVH